MPKHSARPCIRKRPYRRPFQHVPNAKRFMPATLMSKGRLLASIASSPKMKGVNPLIKFSCLQFDIDARIGIFRGNF